MGKYCIFQEITVIRIFILFLSRAGWRHCHAILIILAGPHHTTTPSRVTSTGLHLSHHLHPRDTSHDLSSSSSSPSNHEDRVYIKLTAFEKTLYLNLSANSEFLPGGVVVEVAREDGSVERRGPSQNSCHYVGHIHHSVLPQEGGEEGGLGGAMEGSWAAVSTCNGLVS